MPSISLTKRIAAFVKLGSYILDSPAELNSLIETAHHHNAWFTPENVSMAIQAIGSKLNENNLEKWLASYSIKEDGRTIKIGLVLAGNIPMVGFHDILCVLLTGHHAIIKLSSQDTKLIPHLLNLLTEIEPAFSEKVSLVERLTGFDAVIATGSDNTSRYFEYYFGKYPHLIRKNRNSIAILNGKENSEDFNALGKDIFSYFGLGCRNVSKLFVPRHYNFAAFFEGIESYRYVLDNHKYANNYDYNRTILLMNNTPHFDNLFLMVEEHAGYSSPMASVYFEYYDQPEQLEETITNNLTKIQCVVSKDGWFRNSIPFGKAQEPELWDYADGIDTIGFLFNLAPIMH